MISTISVIIGFSCIVIWIIVGYLLAKSKKIAAKLFALYFSLGLGGIKLYLSLSIIKYPESMIIGIVLFLIALGIGYPLAYIIYKKRIQNKVSDQSY